MRKVELGSPPPTRGKELVKDALGAGVGITPAYAGKRQSTASPVITNQNGTVLTIQLAMLQIEERHTVADLRQRLKVRTLDTRQFLIHRPSPKSA